MMAPYLLPLLCAVALAHNNPTQSSHTLKVHHLRAEDLPRGVLSKSDAYVKVFKQNNIVGRTSVRENDCNPWWKENFTCSVQDNARLKLEVHDRDRWFTSDDLLGTCLVHVKAKSHLDSCASHQDECELEKGGKLYYEYTLE